LIKILNVRFILTKIFFFKDVESCVCYMGILFVYKFKLLIWETYFMIYFITYTLQEVLLLSSYKTKITNAFTYIF